MDTPDPSFEVCLQVIKNLVPASKDVLAFLSPRPH